MRIKSSIISSVIFLAVVVVQALTASYEQAGMISMLKYLVCCIGIGFTVIVCKPKSRLFFSEVKSVIAVVAVFSAMTILKVCLYGNFSIRFFYEIFFMVLPILYACCILNTMSFRQIDRCMFISLIISFIGYFISLGMDFSEIITGLKTMNYSTSYSMLESHSFAGISLAFAFYYLYFRKNRIGMILSVLFVIMTFKRLAVLTVILLLFIPQFLYKDKAVDSRLLLITKIGVFIVGLLYFVIMIPSSVAIIKNILGFDIDKFTMGRAYRFRFVYEGIGFKNGGFGSVYTYLMNTKKMSIELDICKLIFEVTPLGVWVFINNFYNITKKSMYCYIIMCYLFLNMITSHCLANIFTWLFVYVTFGMIMYKTPEKTKKEEEKSAMPSSGCQAIN